MSRRRYDVKQVQNNYFCDVFAVTDRKFPADTPAMVERYKDGATYCGSCEYDSGRAHSGCAHCGAVRRHLKKEQSND
jgi:hypothetical protein